MIGLNAVKGASFGTIYCVLDSAAVQTVVDIVYVAVFSGNDWIFPFSAIRTYIT
jgi:hypothetical protein